MGKGKVKSTNKLMGLWPWARPVVRVRYGASKELLCRVVRRGNCYVTCEALYHLLGGKKAGWVAKSVKHEGDTHWWLELRRQAYYASLSGRECLKKESYLVFRLDPTVSQFKTPPDYSAGRARGFLTKKPSRRAKALMKLLVWQ